MGMGGTATRGVSTRRAGAGRRPGRQRTRPGTRRSRRTLAMGQSSGMRPDADRPLLPRVRGLWFVAIDVDDLDVIARLAPWSVGAARRDLPVKAVGMKGLRPVGAFEFDIQVVLKMASHLRADRRGLRRGSVQARVTRSGLPALGPGIGVGLGRHSSTCPSSMMPPPVLSGDDVTGLQGIDEAPACLGSGPASSRRGPSGSGRP